MEVIIVTLIAAFLTQVGYFLWKVSADSLSNKENANKLIAVKKYFSNLKWFLGFICIILGWIFFIKASDLGEISLVEPLMSIGDLFLVILAVIFLNERLTINECIGLGLTILGAGLLSIGAKSVAPVAINWIQLYLLITVTIVLGTILLILSKKYKKTEVLLAVIVGFAFGTAAILTELMTAYLSKNGLSLPSIYFVLNPIFPFMMAANIAGLVFIQVAFQKGRASVIVPIQLSVTSAIAVLGGAIVFNEAIPIIRILSITIVLLGVFFLNG